MWRMSWWSSWRPSQDASPLYGKLLKGFGCHTRRSGHLSGLVEKPFPLQGYSTHKTILQCWNPNQLLSCFACKILTFGSEKQPLRCHLLSHGCAEPDVVSQALLWPWLSRLQLCCSLPLQARSNPACHSWWLEKGGIFWHALACCAAPQNQVLKILLCLLPYGGNK